MQIVSLHKNMQAEDLKLLMSRLEHWAHRLFLKMSFDDFIERLEKLGSKKEIMASLMYVFHVVCTNIYLYSSLDGHMRVMEIPVVRKSANLSAI